MAVFLYITTIVVGILSAFLYSPLKREALILGVLRPLSSWEKVHGIENRVIEDTVACEDLHYHEPSGLLYSACMDDMKKASGWFPGSGTFDHPENPSFGTLVVIDSKTMKTTKLSLAGFPYPVFVTHGISIYSHPSDNKTVFIFAVNHHPNQIQSSAAPEQPKADSRVELFIHTVGSDTAKHLRSISHPLIRTPNDLLALSDKEFLVTNCHYYRDGLMRFVEDLSHIAWTDIIHVNIDGDNVTATAILNSIGTNNGLGWGPNEQVLIGDATGGNLYFAGLVVENKTLSVSHYVSADGIVDNPSFFSDPYTEFDGKDYSGYILPGLGRPIDLAVSFRDPTGKAPIPSLVWFVPASAGKKGEGSDKQARLLFSDDGSSLRGVTTAVMVAIDPATNDGKREGWLFLTGVVAPNMLATKIDFATILS
ncbi:calcium-dependent phosphotriesterase [Annulohypoxylon maeteangense]|uniref:calcium-dependent phosphotriesterase n=1 Tax=Annulohypoxylon maeteangense TaxID=1927788 RepID=UPI0020072F7B|nr:calcium-dependent phosphotriesterase [Annulohypoxylon maeteangense]KAI0888216.1 calcium-dependent phosphotriesterase [Annulohypoxylon maeteangense]